MDEQSFVSRSKDGSEGQFSRERKLPFKSLIVMLLRGIKSSLQRELDSFFKTVLSTDYHIRSVTKGALSQSRRKLKAEAFKEINDVACSGFYSGAPYQKWQGHRLLSVDGSRLHLPNHPSVKEEFGEYLVGRKASSPVSMGLISLLYDPLNLLTLDSQIASWSESEQSLLLKHMDKLQSGDVLLADRGYPGIYLFYLLRSKGVDFCFRMKEDWWLPVRNFIESGKRETVVAFSLPAKDYKREKGDVFKKEPSVKCRLLLIELENGEKEVLCTSLPDSSIYSYEVFKNLYHLRWGVEEGYKLLKERLDLEDFSGKTAKAVKQDFHAKILMMTLCAALSFPIEEKVRQESRDEKNNNLRKHEKKINRTSALGVFYDIAIGIFIKRDIENALKAFDQLMTKTCEIIRPDRTNPRIHRTKKVYYMNKKRL
nr:IS4 family transposase [Parabacteroides sp. PF5-9]